MRCVPDRCERLNSKSNLRGANGHVSAYSNVFRTRPTATAVFSPLTQQPLIHRRTRTMALRTQYGSVSLDVIHGQDPKDKHWGCPIRERWGLSDHQQLTFAFQDKLAFTATATASYAEAASLAEKWGAAVSPSLIHNLVQSLGEEAEKATQQRMKETPKETHPERPPSKLGVLMMDGWIVRQRGPGWGKKKTKENRSEWREWKTGVYFPLEQSVRTTGDRGMITGKVVMGWQGDPVEFGSRLNWEAVRAGLGRTREQLVVGDGAAWIWNLAGARWPQAEEVLDFYHASQHLWELGKALEGENEEKIRAWVEPRRHRLRMGGEKKVLKEIAALKPKGGASGMVVQREQEYFAGHAHRMNYRTTHRKGWPIGSGAVESACRQRQCRFKRPGQFWTATGMRNLGALTEARLNLHWEELWSAP